MIEIRISDVFKTITEILTRRLSRRFAKTLDIFSDLEVGQEAIDI